MTIRPDAAPNATPSAIDSLFTGGAYSRDAETRQVALLAAMNEAFRYHVANCPAFARFCARRGFDGATVFERLEDFPYLPTQAFKEFPDLLCSAPDGQIRTRLQSSATSGRASTVLIDAVTARRQVLALTSVITASLGGKRRPFIICDVDPAVEPSAVLGARMAAVRGFLNLAREAHYIMRSRADGSLEIIPDKLDEALTAIRAKNEPFVVFGFTYVLYADVMEPLLARAAALPSQVSVVHIGGWKKLEDRKVSRERFEDVARHVFGAERKNVVDFYGFTEQMGVVYPAAGSPDRMAPDFAEVIVRDPDTHAPLPPGKPGLLQFLTPLPHSYPGISVITDDIGVILERSEGDAPAGTRFQVLGRAKNAEVRGCGDVMADKMVSRGTAQAITQDVKARLLFHRQPFTATGDALKPVQLDSLPEVEDIGALCAELRRGRAALDRYSYDELAALIGAAAQRWASPEAGLDALRQQGLQFLASWCRPDHLARLGDEALKGARGYMDAFRTTGAIGRQLRAYPRGLVAHWLSGNVPLLGMLALTQAILTRNANILKSASTFSSALPLLLNAFRDLEVRTVSGKVLRGDDLLESIAVVYFPKDADAAAQMSMAADVRVAWGGRDAVEAIGRLPRRYDAEDIMFGPKLSYMVIGHEHLSDERSLKKIARKAATDASVFDQYACSSPHTIFVETGAAISPYGFAERLAREMAGTAVRIPKMPTDAGTAAAVTARRLRYEFSGDLWTSSGTTWSVLYDADTANGLADPCYSRTVTVRAADDILATADFATADIQTIGVGLIGERRQIFADRAAAHGAYRFPEIGRMTEFDTVWDGMYMMDRFVKWISLGGPVT